MSGIQVVPGAPSERAAVGMLKSDVGVIHAGIFFRPSDGSCQVIHLAFHCQLECESSFSGWFHVVPNLDPVELDVVAAHCAVLQEIKPEIPYGFAFRTSTFTSDGRFVPGAGESGLTCSTFVLSIFEWARAPLLQLETWQARPDDGLIQQMLVEYLKKRATSEHVAAVQAEVGCVRFRTEEAAAATAMEGRPVAYVAASAEGARVKASFDQLLAANGN